MIKRALTKPMRLTLDEPKLNKRNTIEEYCEQLLDVTEYETVEARCLEVIVMNKKEYETFKNNLLKDWNFLEGLKCGTGSDYEPEREIEHIWQLTREEMEMWKKYSYRVATMIFNKIQMKSSMLIQKVITMPDIVYLIRVYILYPFIIKWLKSHYMRF